MIDVLCLERLQGNSRFAQDFVLPRQKLGAKIIALAVVHERLFFGGSIAFQLFQVQPVCDARRPKSVGSRAPYIAESRDRQYRLQPGSCVRRKFPPAEPVRNWGAPRRDRPEPSGFGTACPRTARAFRTARLWRVRLRPA